MTRGGITRSGQRVEVTGSGPPLVARVESGVMVTGRDILPTVEIEGLPTMSSDAARTLAKRIVAKAKDADAKARAALVRFTGGAP